MNAAGPNRKLAASDQLGSVNPMFLLPAAVANRGEAVAKGWAGSLTLFAIRAPALKGGGLFEEMDQRYFRLVDRSGGALSLLAEAVDSASDDPETVRRFAGRMQGEAARLGNLVNDLVDLSKLQDVDPLEHSEHVDVDHVVREAVDATRNLATGGEIELVVGERSGSCVLGDEQQLVMALRNLVTNAITYSPPRTRVGVAVRTGEGVVEISVTDQGMGIPPEEQDRIFERFYRVDPARSRATGGTGLGLALVKHVCVNHAGECTVWSVPGEGSTFTLRLPEAPAHLPSEGDPVP